MKTTPAPQTTTEWPVLARVGLCGDVVKSQPRRVTTFSCVNVDVTLALGVVPVGMAEDSFRQNANKFLPWKGAGLAGI